MQITASPMKAERDPVIGTTAVMSATCSQRRIRSAGGAKRA